MRNIVRAAFLSLALSALVHPAFAEQEDVARKAVAERVVALTSTKSVTEAMIAAVWPPVRDSVLAQNPSATEDMLDALRGVMADTTRELAVEMSSDVVAFYAEEFELAELEAMEEFYRSETGTKLLALTPKLMGQVMPLMLSKSQSMMPKLMEEMRQAAEARGLRLDI